MDDTFTPGELVWTLPPFEDLYMPYKICIGPYQDGRNTFVRIIPLARFNELAPLNRQQDMERMNVRFLSRAHPKGWKFIIQDN